MAVATYDVRTLAVKGKNGYGHVKGVLANARQLGCDFIGLQETRRSGEDKSFLLQGTGSMLWARGNGRQARIVRS